MIDLQALRNLNPYLLIRPLIFRMDAEEAHHATLKWLKKGIAPRFKNNTDQSLRVKLLGMEFPNPIGLAAGFDKNAEVIPEMFGFGFGAVEVGSITPRPQAGNPKPRVFRLEDYEAVINRYGMNSDGFDACLRRIIAYRDSTHGIAPGIFGINIGKNKDSEDMTADYVAGVKKFAPFADYLTLNVSSPNTPGLRNLQGREMLTDLLQQVIAARDALPKRTPLFVKIAPDLSDGEMADIADVALATGIDAMIVGNTTVSRPEIIPQYLAKETGGLSGKPLFEFSTRVLVRMYKLTGGKIPLVGCGGVSNGAEAYAKILAGASLVQLYTALIYQGPLLVTRINAELSTLLKRDGFRTVAEALGKGVA